MQVLPVDTGTAEYRQVWQLREDVLRRPLGLSLNDEDPAEEAGDITLAAFEEGIVQGCVMLRRVNEKIIKLRQMAVAPGIQGRGVGRELVVNVESWAEKHGYDTIVLHARMTAVPFYEKLGYTATGDVFTEVGIPHVLMQKTGW